MQIKTEKQYKQGMIVEYEDKKYKVLASIDCQWLYGVSNYLTVLEEV